MALLFALLAVRAPLPAETHQAADALLVNLSLLLVPAGVGVVQQLDLLRDEGFRLAAVVILSVVVTLAVTAVTFAALAHWLSGDAPPSQHDGNDAP